MQLILPASVMPKPAPTHARTRTHAYAGPKPTAHCVPGSVAWLLLGGADHFEGGLQGAGARAGAQNPQQRPEEDHMGRKDARSGGRTPPHAIAYARAGLPCSSCGVPVRAQVQRCVDSAFAKDFIYDSQKGSSRRKVVK